MSRADIMGRVLMYENKEHLVVSVENGGVVIEPGIYSEGEATNVSGGPESKIPTDDARSRAQEGPERKT